MTEPTVTPNISDCQFQKSFIQAGLFPEDGDVILLTKKEKKAACQKAYGRLNKEKYNANAKAWRAANPEKAKKSSKEWQVKNPEKMNISYKKYNNKIAKYYTYKDRLQKYENISQNPEGTLMVVCAYCGKNYNPTNTQVNSRIQAITNSMKGEQRFYCSNLCRVACPTYYQKLSYKFQHIGHTREVPSEFRHIALKDRKYICENCGSDENGLHIHHILGYTEMPMFMADLPNVKVLCANCHKAVHSVPGCYYVDYSCKNQKQ